MPSRISQTTHSIPGIWTPDTDSANVISGTYPAKQLVTGGREVTVLKLVSGSGAAHVDLYNWIDDGTHLPPANALNWVLDCGSSNNDTQTFASPLQFKGLFAVLTEGSGSDPEVCFSVIPTTPTY